MDETILHENLFRFFRNGILALYEAEHICPLAPRLRPQPDRPRGMLIATE